MVKKLTKEEIGYKTTDKLSKMWLLNPHDHHFLYQREDGSFYGYTNIKDSEDGVDQWFWEPDGIQTELPWARTLPEKQEVGTDAPHHNALERYYGPDHKFTEVEGLEDHYE